MSVCGVPVLLASTADAEIQERRRLLPHQRFLQGERCCFRAARARAPSRHSRQRRSALPHHLSCESPLPRHNLHRTRKRHVDARLGSSGGARGSHKSKVMLCELHFDCGVEQIGVTRAERRNVSHSERNGCAGLTEAATRSASAFTESLHAGGSAFAPLPAACAFAAWGKAHRVVSTSTATAKISARDFFSWRDRRKCRIGQREIQFRFANRHSSTALSREVRGHKRRVCGEQIHLRDLADLAFEGRRGGSSPPLGLSASLRR